MCGTSCKIHMSDMKFITATIVFEIVASSVGGIPGRIWLNII